MRRKKTTEDKLLEIYQEAHRQVTEGKGRERHGLGRPYDEQPIHMITKEVGLGFPIGQAVKKALESQVLVKTSRERAVEELKGAMNYLREAAYYIRECLPDKLNDEMLKMLNEFNR